MRLLLVDDHRVLSSSLAVALRSHGIDDVAIAPDVSTEEVLAAAQQCEATLALVDLYLGEGSSGLALIEPLRSSGVTVMVLTSSTDADLWARALDAGALTVIDKAAPFDELLAVLRAAAAGEPLPVSRHQQAALAAARRAGTERARRLAPFSQLTPREADVMRALVAGASPKAIARDEGISVATVRGHLRALFSKLDVASQREALALARNAGWPPDEHPP